MRGPASLYFKNILPRFKKKNKQMCSQTMSQVWIACCALYSAHWTCHIALCTVRCNTLQKTSGLLRSSSYNQQGLSADDTRYLFGDITHYILHTTYYTLHTSQYIKYTTHNTLNTAQAERAHYTIHILHT